MVAGVHASNWQRSATEEYEYEVAYDHPLLLGGKESFARDFAGRKTRAGKTSIFKTKAHNISCGVERKRKEGES